MTHHHPAPASDYFYWRRRVMAAAGLYGEHRYQEMADNLDSDGLKTCRTCSGAFLASALALIGEGPTVYEQADAWLHAGILAGYCGPPVCTTHDSTPTTEAEDQAFEDGIDLCVFVIRPYANDTDKAAVEANHSPSVWRKQ
jgi:hypothetical protein